MGQVIQFRKRSDKSAPGPSDADLRAIGRQQVRDEWELSRRRQPIDLDSFDGLAPWIIRLIGLLGVLGIAIAVNSL